MDQHDRLAGAVVLVVELDVGAVFLSNGDVSHVSSPFGLVRTVVLYRWYQPIRIGRPAGKPSKGALPAGMAADAEALQRS